MRENKSGGGQESNLHPVQGVSVIWRVPGTERPLRKADRGMGLVRQEGRLVSNLAEVTVFQTHILL